MDFHFILHFSNNRSVIRFAFESLSLTSNDTIQINPKYNRRKNVRLNCSPPQNPKAGPKVGKTRCGGNLRLPTDRRSPQTTSRYAAGLCGTLAIGRQHLLICRAAILLQLPTLRACALRFSGGEREAVRRLHALAAGGSGGQVLAAQRVRGVREPQGSQHGVSGGSSPLLLAGTLVQKYASYHTCCRESYRNGTVAEECTAVDPASANGISYIMREHPLARLMS